jgi:hypothetical protein
VEVAHLKNSVRKALKVLRDEGVLDLENPIETVAVLRLCGREFGDIEVGEYLGEEGRGTREAARMVAVRRLYMGGLELTGRPFDEALRHMLTEGGFRLPGEAQKIDRLTSAFAAAYFDANRLPETAVRQWQAEVDAAAAAEEAVEKEEAAAAALEVHVLGKEGVVPSPKQPMKRRKKRPKFTAPPSRAHESGWLEPAVVDTVEVSGVG